MKAISYLQKYKFTLFYSIYLYYLPFENFSWASMELKIIIVVQVINPQDI